MPVHQDTEPEDIECCYKSNLNVLVKKYGCKLVDCNFETRYLEIDCPDSADRVRLAQEIDRVFSQWRDDDI